VTGRWRVSSTRVCAVAQVGVGTGFAFSSEWFTAALCVILAGWMWAWDSVDWERQQLRAARTVTHTVEIHQRVGESAEVFARRLADELRRSSSDRGPVR
jgi:hypothetical protein